jgi:hypothetical protein
MVPRARVWLGASGRIVGFGSAPEARTHESMETQVLWRACPSHPGEVLAYELILDRVVGECRIGLQAHFL